MNKRNLFVWSLYDFANSIVMIVFILYFSQWLVIDRGISDFWFNITFTISSLLLLFSGPIAGAIVDKTKIKMPGLRITTVFTAIFYLLTGIIAVQYPSQTIMAMIMFTLATYFYMFSFNYYNPLINDIAPQGKHGIVSGWGIFGNYLGHITGILVALPFATGAITLWGNPGRAQVFIPATVIFILSTLPMLLLFKEKSIREQARVNIADEYKNAFRSFVNLCKESKLGYFFLAYFFFNDAVITASNNFPIYLEKVFSASDFIKSLILIGILATSVIGSPISGWIADRIGIKKTLRGVLICWIIIFPLMAITTSFAFFIFLSMLMGLWFGAIWTVARAYLAKNVPNHKLNLSFSYYTIIERFATFIGPVSWGLIVSLAPHTNAINYRIAAFSMAIFVLIGFLVSKKIPDRN